MRKLPTDGILKSKRFAGLWIDTQALLRDDLKRTIDVLNEGLASPEHARFVRRLEAAGKKITTKKPPRKNDE